MNHQYTVLVLVLVLECVLLMPVLRYLFLGWHAKREDIMDGLSADSRLKYFEMFCKNDGISKCEDAFHEMDRMYARWYGRRLFVAPVLLLVVVGGISVFLAVSTALRNQGLVESTFAFIDVKLIGVAAIAGAYMWVVNDFIARSRRLDFSPADVHWGVLRLTIAIPLGYAIAGIASDSAGPLIAFGAGAFPLATLIGILQRTTLSKTGNAEPVAPQDDHVIKLQGVNKAIAERLANEDITTVTQVAYCDPVRLTMRSNLTFNVVTDLMNQALAWEYLDDGMDKIRPFGLRGAVEIRHFIDALGGKGAQAVRAKQALPEVAKALGQTEPTLLNAFDEIARDPFTDYLFSIWE